MMFSGEKFGGPMGAVNPQTAFPCGDFLGVPHFASEADSRIVEQQLNYLNALSSRDAGIPRSTRGTLPKFGPFLNAMFGTKRRELFQGVITPGQAEIRIDMSGNSFMAYSPISTDNATPKMAIVREYRKPSNQGFARNNPERGERFGHMAGRELNRTLATPAVSSKSRLSNFMIELGLRASHENTKLSKMIGVSFGKSQANFRRMSFAMTNPSVGCEKASPISGGFIIDSVIESKVIERQFSDGHTFILLQAGLDGHEG